MKTLQILIFFVCFSQPIAIRANTVEGISDFDGSFTGIERIDFECPQTNVRKIRSPNEESEAQLPKKNLLG